MRLQKKKGKSEKTNTNIVILQESEENVAKRQAEADKVLQELLAEEDKKMEVERKKKEAKADKERRRRAVEEEERRKKELAGGGGGGEGGDVPAALPVAQTVSPARQAQGPLGPGDKFRGKISRSVWKKSRIVNGLRIHGGDCQACGL